METDSSYQITEFSNINGSLFSLHRTKNKDFCHLKITPRSNFWAWINENVGGYSTRILLMLILVTLGLLKMISYEFGKLHVIIVSIGFLVFLYTHYHYVTEENIICIKDLGIQMSTVYFTGKTLQEFIPQAFIADCVINEVIYSQRIIFVLTILVSKTEDTLNYSDNRYTKIDRAVTLFKRTKPRLKTLELVQKEIRKVIFEENDFNEELGS